MEIPHARVSLVRFRNLLYQKFRDIRNANKLRSHWIQCRAAPRGAACCVTFAATCHNTPQYAARAKSKCVIAHRARG